MNLTRRPRPDHSWITDGFFAQQLKEVSAQGAIQWVFATLTFFCVTGGYKAFSAVLATVILTFLLIRLSFYFRLARLCFYWGRGTNCRRMTVEHIEFLCRFAQELLDVFQRRSATANGGVGDVFYKNLELQTWHWLCQLQSMKDLAVARGLVEVKILPEELSRERFRAAEKVWHNHGRLHERLPDEPEATFVFIKFDQTAGPKLQEFASHCCDALARKKSNA